MNTKEKIELLKKAITDVTINGKTVDDVLNKKIDEKDIKSVKLIRNIESVFEKADFGCQTVHVKRLMEILASEITGKKITISIKGNNELSENAFYMVAPLNNDNGHKYPVGKALLMSVKRYDVGITPTGNGENYLPIEEGENIRENTDMRLATPEEIDWYFKALALLGTEDDVIAQYEKTGLFA